MAKKRTGLDALREYEARSGRQTQSGNQQTGNAGSSGGTWRSGLDALREYEASGGGQNVKNGPYNPDYRTNTRKATPQSYEAAYQQYKQYVAEYQKQTEFPRRVSVGTAAQQAGGSQKRDYSRMLGLNQLDGDMQPRVQAAQDIQKYLQFQRKVQTGTAAQQAATNAGQDYSRLIGLNQFDGEMERRAAEWQRKRQAAQEAAALDQERGRRRTSEEYGKRIDALEAASDYARAQNAEGGGLPEFKDAYDKVNAGRETPMTMDEMQKELAYTRYKKAVLDKSVSGRVGEYAGDLATQFISGGADMALGGLGMVLGYLEQGANGAAAWALRDLAKAVPDGSIKDKMLSLADDFSSYYTGESMTAGEETARYYRDELNRIGDEIEGKYKGVPLWIQQQMPSAGNMLFGAGLSGIAGVNNLVTLGLTSGGNSALEAKDKGASDAQALAYGVVAGGLEVFSERLFGGNPIYDADAGLINQAVGKLTSNKTIMKILNSKAFDIASEGLEEVVTEVLDPVAEWAIYNGDNTEFADAASIGNAFLGGVFLSAIGNVADAPKQLQQARYERVLRTAGSELADIAQSVDSADVQEAAQVIRDKIAYGVTPDAADIGAVLDAMDQAGETVDVEQVREAVDAEENEAKAAQAEAAFQTYNQYADERDAKARDAEKASWARSQENTEAINDAEADSAADAFEKLNEAEVKGAADARARQQTEEARAERTFTQESREDADRLLTDAARRYGFDDRMTSVLLSGYDGAQDAQQYAEDVNAAYEYGRNGMSLSAAQRAAQGVNADVAQEAWNAGRASIQRAPMSAFERYNQYADERDARQEAREAPQQVSVQTVQAVQEAARPQQMPTQTAAQEAREAAPKAQETVRETVQEQTKPAQERAETKPAKQEAQESKPQALAENQYDARELAAAVIKKYKMTVPDAVKDYSKRLDEAVAERYRLAEADGKSEESKATVSSMIASFQIGLRGIGFVSNKTNNADLLADAQAWMIGNAVATGSYARLDAVKAFDGMGIEERTMRYAAELWFLGDSLTQRMIREYNAQESKSVSAAEYVRHVRDVFDRGALGESLAAARDRLLGDGMTRAAWNAGKGFINGEEAGSTAADDGGKRDAGMDSGEQAGAVAEGTGGAKTRSAKASAVAERIELENRVRAAGQPYLSGKDIGLEKGSAQRSFREAPESTWTDSMKDAAAMLRREGFKEVHFTVGAISVENQRAKVTRYADGVVTGNTVWINATSKKWTVEQLAKHEAFHHQIQDWPYAMDAVRQALADELGEDGIQELAQRYAEAYEGCYDGAELDAYIEEICADAYAGMDRLPEEKARIVQQAAQRRLEAQRAEKSGETRGPPEKYSIGEIKGEKKKYGSGVVLDTDIFEGVRQRDWGKTLGTYVYENMAGAELTMFDEDGNPEVVYLARENDRVKKDGAKNSHKVLDKLAGYRGDTIRAKAIVQLDEVLETSRSKEITEDHSHQWLDAHGWIIRNAYLQDESGNIYEATLNIANGKDRKILYEVNRVHQIDKIKSPGEHTVTDNGQRFRYQKPGTGGAQSETKDNINENAANVKEHFSISEDSDGRQLTEAQREFFKDSKAVDEKGRLLTLYHGTGAKFTVFDKGRIEQNFQNRGGDLGFYFSPYIEDAQGYAREAAFSTGGEKAIMEVYLNLKNPLVVEDEGWGSAISQADIRHGDLKRWAQEGGNDGIIVKSTDEVDDDGTPDAVYIAFSPEQIKSVTNKNPTGNPDIRYSVAEDAQEEGGTTAFTLDSIPKKAQDYLRRVRGQTAAAIQQTLSMPFAARQEVLKPAIEEMMNEYLQTGRISQETVDRNFEESYRRGVEMDTEFYDQYKDVKTRLRDLKVTLSEEDRADIADFDDFRRAASGRLRIANEGGLPVDVAYKEMQQMAPELFPESITHPADQLMRMFEVSKRIEKVQRSLDEYHGEDAEEFKRWAKNDYEASVENMLGALNVARRYAEARMRQQQARAVPTTMEEVKSLYADLKGLRRTYERAAAKNLLTAEDNSVLNRLLRGEITPEDVQGMENAQGILAMYEAKADYDAAAAKIADWRRYRKGKLREQADNLLKNAEKAKDKKAGIEYSRETMTRNVRDIFPEADAEAINKTYFEPVRTASANANKLKNKLREQVKALDLSRKARKGDAVSEAHAVQLLGEAQDNIRYLEQHPRAKDRDGKTLNEWRQIVLDLWATSPGLDRAKIENAVETFRKIYDGLFEQMNDVRIRNGYEPINYRQGYFPHFQPGTTDGILGLMGKALGIDAEVTALPTTISGLTHTFKPGITYFGNALERIGFDTAYDAVEGFDKYVEGAASVICYTDAIQNLRALAQQVRYRTSDEGLRERVDDIRARDDLTEHQKELEIKEIMDKGQFSLSNFAVELDEYTNLLANKKSKYDRSMEHLGGRKLYNFMRAWQNRVAANMVAVNPASWLTNFGVITQAGAQLKTISVLKGMWQTLANIKTNDGLVEASDFLTNRAGSDPLVRTWQQSASAFLSTPMEWIDQFSAGTIVRARYMENIERGMSEETAMREADDFAANVMADRSKGAMPTLFEARNPLMKMFTQFQLEVNNTYSYLFKDLPREQRKKGVRYLALALFKFLIGGFLYNELYEYLIGRRPMLDPLGIVNDTVGDLTGYELNNLVDTATGGGLIKESEPESAVGTIQNLAENVGQEAPFIGNLMGGGKLPFSSSMPNVKNILTALDSETATDEEKLAKIGKEMVNPAAYWLLPFGGGQIKKMWQGISALKRQGSYTADGRLQYPIYTDREGDKANAAWRTLLFGKSATPEAQAWVEAGFGALSEKETQTYEAMRAGGVDQRDSYELIKAMSKVKKTDTQTKEQLQMQLLNAFDIEDSGKVLYYYNMMASDKERAQIDKLLAEGADMGEYLRYLQEKSGVTGEKDADGKTISGSVKEETFALIDGLNLTPEQKTELAKEDYTPTGFEPWTENHDRLYKAVSTGKDLRSTLKGLEKDGYEPKEIRAAITDMFRDEYLAADKAGKARLKGYLRNAFMVSGLSQKEAENKIKKWEEAQK